MMNLILRTGRSHYSISPTVHHHLKKADDGSFHDLTQTLILFHYLYPVQMQQMCLN